jgi:16S rRNA (guanine527-N7)-methyltransferase
MPALWPFDIPLDEKQHEQLLAYARELQSVNRQFNLVSRVDESHVQTRHIGHCLALGTRRIPAETAVIDWGTGGGLPAIVLGILFPDTSVLGVDSNQKKTRSVDLFARRLGIPAVRSWHGRAEACIERANLSVSRATAPLKVLWSWHAAVALPPRIETREDVWKDGLLCLKGGQLDAEIAALTAEFPNVIVERTPLRQLTSDPYFETKEIVHVRSTSP